MGLRKRHIFIILANFIILFIQGHSYSMILSDSGIIPIVVYAPGAYGTFWKTDLYIYNSMERNVLIELEFYSQDGKFNKIKEITISKKSTNYFNNIVHEIFDYEGYGLLYMTSDDIDNEIGIWARIYTEREDGGSYGQAIDNQLIFSNIKTSYLFGIVKNNDYRTNIGICSLFFSSSFSIELYDNNGILLKIYDVDITTNRVFQFPIDVEVQGGWIKIIPKEEKIVYYAYMSLVDNKTGDAVFMPASRKISE